MSTGCRVEAYTRITVEVSEPTEQRPRPPLAISHSHYSGSYHFHSLAAFLPHIRCRRFQSTHDSGWNSSHSAAGRSPGRPSRTHSPTSTGPKSTSPSGRSAAPSRSWSALTRAAVSRHETIARCAASLAPHGWPWPAAPCRARPGVWRADPRSSVPGCRGLRVPGQVDSGFFQALSIPVAPDAAGGRPDGRWGGPFLASGHDPSSIVLVRRCSGAGRVGRPARRGLAVRAAPFPRGAVRAAGRGRAA